MVIYLELLIIFILMIIFIVWKLWYSWSTKKLLKKYSPEKNIARKTEKVEWLRTQNGKTTEGGEQCGAVEETERDVATADKGSIGFKQSEGRKLLQTTDAYDDGKTSCSDRKNGSGIRRLLRRRK